MQITEVIPTEDRLACITLDYEKDYGNRIDEFNILGERTKLTELAAVYRDLDVPVSAFIRTDMLTEQAGSLDLVRELAVDFHSHSHTHNSHDFVSEREFADTQQAFVETFGAPALGYRAPLGVLHDGDIALLKTHGFKFTSSVFPSFFPGRFNNLAMPNTPFTYANGMVELPMAAVPRLRCTVSLSYLKLLGFPLNRAMYRACGLPTPLVFDSHLHDYIVCDQSFRQLPLPLRVAWGVNKHAGIRLFARFVTLLREQGYRFLTMTELYEHVRARSAQPHATAG